MIKTRLLTTAALALVISTGAAYAQTNAMPPSSAPAAQQSAPPDKIAPPMNAGERKGGMPETTGQSSPRSGADSPRAKEGSHPGQAGASSAQGRSGSASEGTRSGAASESGVKDDKAGMNARKSGADAKSGSAATETKSGASTTTSASGTKSSTQSTTESDKSTTSGQGSAGARANLTTEQRTKITSVIKQQRVEPVNLNISISVGTRVPDHVRYYPLPAEVVTIYPQWRGFDYIIVGSTIVVIDPGTREIVAVLEA